MSICSRERFLGICRFERTGDLCLVAPVFNVFWEHTIEEWVKQGAPEQIASGVFRGGQSQWDYFQFDTLRELHEIIATLNPVYIDIGGGVTYRYNSPLVMPNYEPEIITRDEDTVTLIDGGGRKVRIWNDNRQRMPMFLDHPVKDRASWKEYKKRLDPNTPERWPSDWNSYVEEINSTNDPKVLAVGGFFGLLREWMGTEKILYTFYDDPSLIEDMMDQICYLETEIIKRVVKDIRIDCVHFWEDMAYKTGPLISPDMVRKFMMPLYKKVTDILHGSGVDVISVDSDGNVNELIPLWLECGINFHWPLEVTAGNDAVALRKKYGKDIILGGNIDKRALIKGKDAIREEVMSKVPFLLESGGYFPSVDHSVPPDITWENYRYFINTVREVAGLEKLSE